MKNLIRLFFFIQKCNILTGSVYAIEKFLKNVQVN